MTIFHSRTLRIGLWFALVGGLLVASRLPAQDSALPGPRLFTLNPPGGKIGTAVEVAFTGTDLEDPERLVFSHPGIKAEPIIPPVPAVDPKKPAPNPAPPKPPVTKFKVTIPADVPLGNHDCRLVNKWGVSNPRAFVVGDLNEVLEKEPNNDVPEAQKVEINTTINGAMAAPTDVDYFVVPGKKGQRVVMSCQASSIDSRFQPALEVYGPGGRLIAQNNHYRDGNAVTDVVPVEDGDLLVRVFQFTYTQGTAEHFYRLTLTTAPWIDAVHPLVVEPGKPAQLTVWGRNLPGGQPDPTALESGSVLEKLAVTVNVPGDPASVGRLNFAGQVPPETATLNGFEYRLRNAAGFSNPMLLTYARAPVVVDNGTNDTPATAQPITTPCEIAGRIEKKRDRDWYGFTAKKGDTFTIEGYSDRLGSPAALYFRVINLTAMDGKPVDLTESADNADVIAPKFYAGTEDPLPYRFTAPADGKYQLMVSSRLADTLSGPRHLYRVRLTPDQPDFELVVMPYAATRPDSVNLQQGGSQALTVLAVRREGFTEPIQIAVEGLPAGVTCAPQSIGASVKEATLVLSAAPNAAAFTGAINIKGTASVVGKPVVREARAGGIVWPLAQPQPNMPARARAERGVWLAVRGQAPYNLTAAVDKPAIVQGDKGTMTVTLARIWPDNKAPVTAQAVVAELPAGLTLNNNQPITIAANATTGTLPIVVAPTTPPGTYNLVLRTTSQLPFNKDPMAKQKPNVLAVQPSAAVTLSVLPKTLATIALANPSATIKAGTNVELVVNVTRQFNYDGPFALKLVPPANVKDVTAPDATIPAGQNTGKLVLTAPATAAPGGRAGLKVVVTAMYEGKTPVVHEVMFNVNVTK